MVIIVPCLYFIISVGGVLRLGTMLTKKLFEVSTIYLSFEFTFSISKGNSTLLEIFPFSPTAIFCLQQISSEERGFTFL